MATLPKKKDHQTVLDIYEAKAREQREPRGYLGMSSIGNECERAIWYGFRKFTPKPMEGRILLLFSFGDAIEKLLTTDLRRAGYELENAYPDKQASFKDFGGFFSGHCDGFITLSKEVRPRAILECKSTNHNKFAEFQKKGVRETYPTYWAQVQCYMGYAGLRETLFIVQNKDSSEIYAEEIAFDAEAFELLKVKAARIITTFDEAGRNWCPEKAFESKDEQACKWCDYSLHCWEPTEAVQLHQSCLSCGSLLIGKESGWLPYCGNLKHQFQLKNCFASCPDWSFVGAIPWTWDSKDAEEGVTE